MQMLLGNSTATGASKLIEACCRSNLNQDKSSKLGRHARVVAGMLFRTSTMRWRSVRM
jgi:hypothetical protein